MAAHDPDASDVPPAIPGMTTYYLGLLRRGPIWTAEESPELDRLQAAHLANIARLRAEGSLVLAGPIPDGSDLRGIYLFRANSLAEAQALANTDPMIPIGRLVIELHPWLVPTGILL
jgi:uncharacterized protein YciI